MLLGSSFRTGSRGLASATALAIIAMVAPPLLGQTPPASSPVPFARLVIDTRIADESGLGFELPDTTVGFTMEKPAGIHLELQASASYSPAKKLITNDGNSFLWGVKGIWFPRWRVGITGEIRQSHLWTSQFNKSGWIPTAGVLIRDNLLGLPGRFSADYVIPNGCVWATQCTLPADGIQSNRTQGPEFDQEFRALALSRYTLRLGGELSFDHFCDQTNPLVPGPRTCQWADTMAATVRLEFGGKDQWY